MQFVLQADFLLTANREDILQSKKWNRYLIGATIDIFRRSVLAFSAQNVLAYTWPRYVASQGNSWGSIFQTFFEDLVSVLRSSEVIRSDALEALKAPSRLSYVPPMFRTGNKHLLDRVADATKYASHLYSAANLANLRIQRQSDVDFLQLLERDIRVNPSDFRQRSEGWHSQLAQAIIHTRRYSDVRNLNIIPLRNGEWTNARGKIYLPELRESGTAIPCGVSVAIIAESAVADGWRKTLYENLGALQLTSAELYKSVLDQHRGHGTEYGNWTKDVVVAHAWFLFSSPTKPRNCTLDSLWVASCNSPLLQKGQDLYMDDPESDFKVSNYLSHQDVHYVDDSYFDQAPASLNPLWLNWLRTELGVKTRPKLWSAGSISHEFRTIIARSTANSWLLLLKSQYNHYAPSIDLLRTQLALQSVRCFNGRDHAVCGVYLETPSVMAASVSRTWVPTLDVENSVDPLWQNMTAIGLRVRPDLNFYVTSLWKLRETWSLSSAQSTVDRMYKGISQCFEEGPGYVK